MRKSISAVVRGGLAGAVAAAGVLLATPTAQAALPAHPSVVSDDAADRFADLVTTDGLPRPKVDAIAVTNGTVFLGGRFERANDPAGNFEAHNIMAVDEDTGRIKRDWSVQLNGQVLSLVAEGNSLYIGGTFNTVNGATWRNLVKVDATTGQVDGSFRPPRYTRARVNDLKLARGMLFVAGAFGRQLVALNPTTGADTGFVNLNIAGEVPGAAGNTAVYKIAINPAGTRLAAVGNIATVNGSNRMRFFMANLNATNTSLNPFYYQHFARSCRARPANKLAYLQDVDFSPDGSYFVVVATGYVSLDGDHGRTVCDAAARFETNGPSSPNLPTWMNHTGGDTLWNVVITGPAVYVQGHNRWLDNPLGRDSAGPGAVTRKGVGAINPSTGRALAWNPNKPAKIGGKAMLVTDKGLWIGSDSINISGERHRGIAFMPLP